MITLSNGTLSFTPELRIGWASSNASSNLLHALIDGEIAVTLRPDKPRSGRLELLFLTTAAAETARQALVAPGVWTITDDYPAMSLRFVRSGDLGVAQQDDRKRWVLAVGYQEIP